MDYSQLIDQLTPQMIADFSLAVETGKWQDGKALSAEQKESLIQAIMLYKARNDEHASDEPFTVSATGDLRTGKKIRVDFQGETANTRSEKVIDSKTIDD